MPKTPIDYSKSVIYKIEHIDKPELIYVGSTTDFIKRKSDHKSRCNNEKDKKYNCKIYQLIRAHGNWESFKIMVICEYPCNSKTELIIEEEKHRKELQASLNTNKSYCSVEENIIHKKEYYKEYNNNNKEINKIKNKIYRDNNKEKITEYRDNSKEKIKEYRDNNKEKIKIRNKNYRDNNKEKMKEKITCECGSIIKKVDKSTHEKSIKHCQFIQQN
jgi:hypothetical protein